MSKRKLIIIFGVLLLATGLILAACKGGDSPTTAVATGVPGPAGPTGPTGPAGPAGAAASEAAPVAEPETCGICHKGSGANHQAAYDQLYQDGVIQVTNLTYRFTANPDTTIITFKMTKNGAPISGAKVENSAIYFAPFNGKTFEAPGRLALKGKLTYDAATGITTSTLVEKPKDDKAFVDYTNLSATDGLIVLYGRDGTVGQLPERIFQNKYPFAAILPTGAGVKYTSAANDAGCVKCHTDPYLKHGYIYAQVNGDPATDFLTCKACHFDNGEGEHLEWQLLVNDPVLAADFLAGKVELTEEQKKQYEYKTTLMNDVHMSHSMEFSYPQSMANCVTCHEGKLDTILTDANMKIETCKSCHPATGVKGPAEGDAAPAYDTTKLALATIIPQDIHGQMDLATTDCTTCHGEGKSAKTFKQIHPGYDKAIYTAEGQRYSDAIKVSIDAATFDGSKLNIQFSAAADPAIAGLDVASIAPTVMVGLYGWDTKDFVVGAHERPFDDNGDGKVDSKDARALEYAVGSEHPRFTTVSAAGGKWEVTADLSKWTDLITAGTVKRVEIAVLPELVDANKVTLALVAPSKTFDLGANAFDDKFFTPIAKTVDGCNNCHDALAVTFHSADYGGNITVCRMCHITKAGGSHLEMQSRSLDSYIHAIHASQAFDVGSINFADPVEKELYTIHTELPYPNHGITNCVSCHEKGAFEVPDQSASLPSILSASSTNDSWGRNIGSFPSVIVGPGNRACGSCHRAQLINEDKYGDLVALNKHLTNGGYALPAGDKPLDTLSAAFETIMTFFK